MQLEQLRFRLVEEDDVVPFHEWFAEDHILRLRAADVQEAVEVVGVFLLLGAVLEDQEAAEGDFFHSRGGWE
jgi:hypothetical protein